MFAVVFASQAVQALLQNQSEAFSVRMASEDVAHNIERDRLPVVNDEIAAEENRYRLLQILGDGGYGTVFLSQNSQK